MIRVKPMSLIVANEPYSNITEAYRSLRTNIFTNLKENPCRTILVTSTLAGEGKSTTLINIGASLAKTSKRVLLIDTDLRKPVLHKMLDVEGNRGFVDLCSDLMSLSQKNGKLTELSLVDVFYLLRVQERTGVLSLKNEYGTMEIRFYEGEIVGINCSLQENWLGQTVNMGNYSFVEGKMGSFNIWKQFIAKVDHNTHFVFDDTDSITINGGTNRVNWKMLLDNLPNFKHTPGIFALINKYIKPTKVEGLWLLPCGKSPEHPAEFLSSRTVREIFKIVGSCFDIVLLDSPPISPVTDACIMVSYIDGVILVVRSRKVNRSVASDAVEKLQLVNANILGVVINDIDVKNDYYPYHYYKRYPE